MRITQALCLAVTLNLLIGSVAHAENVGCMVYNNGLRFSEEELQRIEASTSIQYVGVQVSGVAPHYNEVASRLAAAGKKLVVQVWWSNWSRYSIANIAMDTPNRAAFFEELLDPIIDAIGPENIHIIHLLEESGSCFGTDMTEPGEPDNLLDGGSGSSYGSPQNSGWAGSGVYGGAWILSLRRHNADFARFSGGGDLFKSAIWRGPVSSSFRRWVGQRVNAQAHNQFAEHIHKKYPNIRATTWDGPNFGGVFWCDTPAMLNNVDGFTSNCYSSPRQNYIYARTLRTLDYDKELDFMTWLGRGNALDAHRRRTLLTGIYAVGSNMLTLWEEPRRCYQVPELWEMMEGIYGTFSKLPVFRHSPQVMVIAGRWGIPSDYLTTFDVAHRYDAEGVGLGRYKLVLADRADHPGMKDFIAAGGLTVVFDHPSFLKQEGILVPIGKPTDFEGIFTPDDWWQKTFGLAAGYELNVKRTPNFAAGAAVHKAEGLAYYVRYGKGQVIVLPGRPANEGNDPDWQLLVYDLIRGLLRANDLEAVFDKHFAPRESGGKYFQITSDDGAVTCYFYYNGTSQTGPPVQVRGIDVLTGDKDPVLGPGRASGIVLHRPAEPWQPPPLPDRTRLVKAPEPGARRGLPAVPELPAGSALGAVARELKLPLSTVTTATEEYGNWAVDEARYRLALRFKRTAHTVTAQPLILTGKTVYELTGLDDLVWQSVRVFTNGSERPVQVDERDGTGHYTASGNGQLDFDDELVFAVSLPTAAATTYHLYFDSKASPPRRWPATTVKFKQVDTATADVVFSNGRLSADLKGPARRPKENGIENFGAGAITLCSLDGKAFTRIRSGWANYFFANPWAYDGGWTKPQVLITGPVRTIVKVHLPHTERKNKAGLKTFAGKVTNYFAMYDTVPILDIEQLVEYSWSTRSWSADYSFYAAVGGGLDANDVAFVPVAGAPRQVSIVKNEHVYREYRLEQGWMAVHDTKALHGCALFYAKMPEVRENLAWVDYAPGRQLTSSIAPQFYCNQMQVKYTNRVMQADDRLARQFRIVGITDEDADDVASQYRIWGRDLRRIADVQLQRRQVATRH